MAAEKSLGQHPEPSYGGTDADAIDAVGFAMHLQEAMLEATWPDEILANPHACLFTSPSGQRLFNGLRVRLAVHTGIPSSIQVCTFHSLAKPPNTSESYDF